jgi:multidrug transporter EmrE-like cation transporter
MRSPLLILLIAVFTLVGDYFLKLASQREASFASVAFVVGILVYGSTAVGWVLVMKHLPLASIGVWYSIITICLLTGLGVFVFGEQVNTSGLALLGGGAGLALLIAGIVALDTSGVVREQQRRERQERRPDDRQERGEVPAHS